MDVQRPADQRPSAQHLHLQVLGVSTAAFVSRSVRLSRLSVSMVTVVLKDKRTKRFTKPWSLGGRENNDACLRLTNSLAAIKHQLHRNELENVFLNVINS